MEILAKPPYSFQIVYWALALCMITLPFSTFLMLPIGILLIINWVIEWNWKVKLQRLKEGKFILLLISSVTIYILYLIGTLYSQNLSHAFSKIEGYTWLLVTPVILFTLDRKWMDQKRIVALFLLFIIGMLLSIMTNIGIATFNSIKFHDTGYFFYVKLARYHHPSYQALYTCVAFSLSFIFLRRYRQRLSKYIRFMLGFSLPIFAGYIFLLESKAGILAFLIILFILFFYLINEKKRRIGVSISVILLFLLLPLLLFQIPIIENSRFFSSIQGIKTFQQETDPTESTQVRLVVWCSSMHVIADNLLFGVGTGDARDALSAQYEKQKLTHIHESRYNCHNQYLESFVALGIPGITGLLFLFAVPLWQAIRRKDALWLLFLMIVLFNFLFESMLERRAGCDFIALFMGLFTLFNENYFKNPDIV